jgi:hypothetical protein
LRTLAAQAKEMGIGLQFVAALKTIDRFLHANPRDFGDPTHQLRKGRLDMYTRVFPPLIVYYGVHKDNPLVFVKEFKLVSGPKS